jgi:hypothetical protein
VLGCTELPLAVRGGISDRVLVDPLVILADAVLAAVTDDDRVVPPSSADR